MRTAQNIILVDDGDMSQTITSRAQQLRQVVSGSIQSVYSGSQLTGILKLQTSTTHREDFMGNILVVGTWDDVTGSSITLAGANSHQWDLNSVIGMPWVRQVYTPGEGDSGTLDTQVSYKAL